MRRYHMFGFLTSMSRGLAPSLLRVQRCVVEQAHERTGVDSQREVTS